MDYTVHGILQARILEWVAFPVSRGSSQTRDWIQVSRIAGGFLTSWTIREARNGFAAAAAAKSLQSCPTLCDPREGSPPGFPVRPWDSPGKNTGVGCHFLLQCEKSKWSRSVVSDSSRPPGLQPTRLLRPWDFLGKSTGVGCHCLLWEWFLEWAKNYWRRDVCKGSDYIL